MSCGQTGNARGTTPRQVSRRIEGRATICDASGAGVPPRVERRRSTSYISPRRGSGGGSSNSNSGADHVSPRRAPLHSGSGGASSNGGAIQMNTRRVSLPVASIGPSCNSSGVGLQRRASLTPRTSAAVALSAPSSPSSAKVSADRVRRGSRATTLVVHATSVPLGGRVRQGSGTDVARRRSGSETSGGNQGLCSGLLVQNKARQVLDEAASQCEAAFQSAEPSKCQEAIYRAMSGLPRVQGRALASPEAARFCAMFCALLQHPIESCREEAVQTAARCTDVSMLLRVAVRVLNSNQLDTARSLQAAENVLKAAKTILVSDAAVVERCRLGGGLIAVVDVWRQGGVAVELSREAAQIMLLFARGHPKAVATSGIADVVLASWQKLPQPGALAPSIPHGGETPVTGPGRGQASAEEAVARDIDSDPAPIGDDDADDQTVAKPPRPLASSTALAVSSLPFGLQLYAELLCLVAPYVGPSKLAGAVPTAVQSVASCATHGPVRALGATLQLMAKMASDASLARELVRLNAPQVVIDLLDLDAVVAATGCRRALANAWVQMVTGAASESRRQLSTTPRLLGALLGQQVIHQAGDASPAVRGSSADIAAVCCGAGASHGSGAGLAALAQIPEPMAKDIAVASAHAATNAGPGAPILSAAVCAAGLRRRLMELVAAPGGNNARVPVYPLPAQAVPASNCGVELDGKMFLRFDANFEGGNLRSASALSATHYELQLSVDISNPAHCQWFYFKVAGMVPGNVYNFYIVNLSKPASLFEEGSQPVILSKKRLVESGIGWTRDGHDIAYYANGAVLVGSKLAHTLAFSLTFPHEDDEVSIAHFYPYGYSDLKRDMARWSRCLPTAAAPMDAADELALPPAAVGLPVAVPPARRSSAGGGRPRSGRHRNGRDRPVSGRERASGVQLPPPPPHSETVGSWTVERRQLLQTAGGLSVETFCVGAAAGSRQVALLIARAHPGESPASWVMRGACDFLLGEASDDAASCRAALTWFIVPMLNPDGVVVGNTRTNFSGVDLNRHHHDELAQETCALRALVEAVLSAGQVVGPPLAFVDMHGHSRRRGVFVMGNAGGSARLPCLLAQRSPLFDFQGSSMNGCNSAGKDAGVGRVAMANNGIPHSFTLEASFGMPHGGSDQLSPSDLQNIGRDLCLSIRDLAESAQGFSQEPLPEEATMKTTFGGDD